MLNKTTIIAFVFTVGIFHSAFAQTQEKLQLEVSASVNGGLYELYPVWGAGVYAKGLWRIGQKGNALITGLDVSRLHERYMGDTYAYTYILSSFGFRKVHKQFFVEFKGGVGVFADEDYFNPCGFIGVEPGFQKNKFSFSLDYRLLSAEDLADGAYFNTLALKVGYRITGIRK